MSSYLKQLLKTYHLDVVYKDIHGNGYIVRTPAGYPNLLFIRNGLTDEETENVILHEVGHAENDDHSSIDYKDNYSTRLTTEHGANNYLIEERIKQYVAYGNDIASSNYVDLANSLGVKDYDKVKNELKLYLE